MTLEQRGQVGASDRQDRKRAENAPAREPELLTQIQICRRLGICVATWRNWRAARRVPAPVPDLPGRPRWRRVDIETFERGLSGAGRRFFGTARTR